MIELWQLLLRSYSLHVETTAIVGDNYNADIDKIIQDIEKYFSSQGWQVYYADGSFMLRLPLEKAA